MMQTKYRLCLWFLACLLVSVQGQGDFPSLRRQFQDLPCLAPIIERIDENAPKTVEEALSLPPYESPEPGALLDVEGLHFPVTHQATETDKVRQWFDQGLGLFHLGSMLEAERCFREVVRLDPKCPMAFLGLALVNERVPRRAELYVERALHLAEETRLTKREKAWLRVYRDYYDPLGNPISSEGPKLQREREKHLSADLENLVRDYPDDVEAKGMLLRTLAGRWLASNDRPDFALGLDLLGEVIAKASSFHPSQVHFIKLHQRFAPDQSSATALEFLKQGYSEPQMYAQASAALFASRQHASSIAASEMGLRVLHRQAASRKSLPAYQEAYEPLVLQHLSNLVLVGRIREALDWLEVLERVPRLPGAERSPLFPQPQERFTATNLAKMRFRILIRGERWAALETMGEQWSENSQEPILQMLGCLAKHAVARALSKTRDDLTRPETLFRELLASGKVKKESELKRLAGHGREMVRVYDGKASKGVDRTSLSDVYPLEYYLSNLARGGLANEAAADMLQFLSANGHAPLIAAHAISLLLEVDMEDEARLVFSTAFRKSAALGDSDLPIWGHVRPIANKVGLLERWTLPGQTITLPGGEPESVEAMGPQWWRNRKPEQARFLDQDGNVVPLEDKRGKALLVQFFIGVHCGFCLEQLEELAKKAEAFEKVDVEILAVSPDRPDAVKAFLDAAEETRWPFEFLSDSEMEVLRHFRYWDGFEGEAMHGTLLLGADGKILWTFSGHEPFKEWDLLLSEVRRPGFL
ncbi:peroxiredoxin family protein [Verrucomicrobiales bacterium]|nr:peroxiredoxin family protein [Verrucomicrobiales bacterium]